jgi:hypothetical protein
MTPDNAIITNDSRIVTIIDGPPDAQAWVDALIQSARTGSGNMPHQHLNIPATDISLPDLWRAIEGTYSAGGESWSITALGFPPLEGFSGSASAASIPPGGGDGTPDEPNVGSVSHNVLHALLGNFH